MTILTAVLPVDMTEWDLGILAGGTVLTSTATEYTVRVTTPSGDQDYTFTGAGFTFDAGDRLTGGSITGYSVVDVGTTNDMYSLSGFDLSAIHFQRLLDTNDTSGFKTALFGDSDVLTGSSGDDVLQGDPPQHQVRILSVNEDGELANGPTPGGGGSPDGSKVLIHSFADNLVAGDTNGFQDLFLLDLESGAFTRISTASDGSEAIGGNTGGYLSPDGTKVLLISEATNLIAGDTNGVRDIFVKDLATGTVTRVSTASDGTQGDLATGLGIPVFSPDGTKVLFLSDATNLVAGDTNGVRDLFLKDLLTGETIRVSTASDGSQADAPANQATFSPDGTKIAFISAATNLVAGDTNGLRDVFIKDLVTGTVSIASLNSDGTQATAGTPSINGNKVYFSPDGTLLMFDIVSNLGGSFGFSQDAYLKNLVTGELTLVTLNQVNGSAISRGFTPDGKKLLLTSSSNLLVPDDTNIAQFPSPSAVSARDVFLYDIASATFERISVTEAGEQAEGDSFAIGISADGSAVTMLSYAPNLGPFDTGSEEHAYLITLSAPGSSDVFNGGTGNDTLNGGLNVDWAIFSGNRADYAITPGALTATITGPDGTDTLNRIERLQFDDMTLNLPFGLGVSADIATADPDSFMAAIRDFDGFDLGSSDGWLRIGSTDIQGDGDTEHIFVNGDIGRWATIGPAYDGLIYFDDYSWGGDTRVVGIYIDPEVIADPSKAGGPFDSQLRFQNDLFIGNINDVFGADDYDGDGLQEVYFGLTDETAYLHAFMHADGNIQYANYQSEQQMIDYLTANGFTSETWEPWLYGNTASASAEAVGLFNDLWNSQPNTFSGTLAGA